MQSIECTPEQKMHLDRLVLSIFTDMTNGGANFNDALSAIYLSGLENASRIGQAHRQNADTVR